MSSHSFLRKVFGRRRRESNPPKIRRAADYAHLERRVVYSAVALSDVGEIQVQHELQEHFERVDEPDSPDWFSDDANFETDQQLDNQATFIDGGEVLAHGVPGSIDGTIYEDLLGDGSVAGDGFFEQANLYLYLDDGNSIPDINDTFLDTQSVAPDGTYAFNGLSDGSYWVVVDSKSIRPTSTSMINTSLHGDMWAEQTFGPANALVTDGMGGQTFLANAGAAFGGLNASVSDNSSRLGFAAGDATPLATSEHLALVTIANDGHVVDFGFSYNVVTTVRGGGDPADTLNHDDDPLANRTVQGSLRQFVQNANNYAGPNAMRFVPMELPNVTSSVDPAHSWWRIDVSHPIDSITDAGTVLDGIAYATDGSIRDTNTLAVGSTTTTGLGSDSILGTADDEASRLLGIPAGLELELVASVAALDAGIETNASDTTIRNISIHGFGNGTEGAANVVVDGQGGGITGVTVEGSLLGAAPDNVTSTLGNASANVFIDSAEAFVRDNVIVRAADRGILVGPNSSSVVIEGNELNANATVINYADAIKLQTTASAQIRDNLITGSGGYGIDIDAGVSGALIENNTITTSGALGFQTAGIRLGGQGATVTNNVITNNAGDGVLVVGRQTALGFPAATQNQITRNSFSDNGGIAIDLTSQNANMVDGDGISNNDGGTSNNSGNIGMDFPTQSPSVLQYDSLISDIAIAFSTNVNLELYAVTSLDPSDLNGLTGSHHGEGTRYIRSYSPGVPAPISHNTNQGFLPTDRVTYLAMDGSGNTSEFSVSYDVNFLPLANDDFHTTSGSIVSGNVITSNDIDEDGDTLQVTAVTSPGNASAFSINPNGDFIYTPNAGFSGLDTFTYTVSDGNGGTRDATVFITVTNSPPNAVDDNYTLLEETSFTTTLGTDDLLLNDSDPDGESLTANLITDVSNGTLSLGTNGMFTYTPNPNFSGTDTFVYEAVDSRNGSSQATVTLNVTNTPDAPVSGDDNYVVQWNTTFSTTSGVDDLLLNDSDPDGDSLTVNTTVVTPPTNGVVALAANGTFSYTPTTNFSGVDTFVYEVSDGTGLTATSLVTLNVNAVPVALPDSYNGLEDQNIVAVASVDDLLLNDSDADGGTLSVNTVPVTAPTNGSLSLSSNGSFIYTPTPDFFGSDSFTYEVTDGLSTAQAIVTLNIADVNDDPVAVDDSYNINEDTVLSPVLNVDDLRVNDTDIDGDTLTVATTPVTDVSNGSLTLNSDGTFQYTPSANYFGSDLFEYQVSDGRGGQAIGRVTITINSVNDIPIALPETYTVAEDGGLTATAGVDGLLDNDTDADTGDNLTVNSTPTSNPSNGSLLLFGSGSFNYIPNADFNGTDTFTYQVTDGNGGTTTATVTINVTPVNDAPAAVDDAYSINEDTTLVTVLGVNDLLSNDSDIENDTLSVNPVPVSNVSNGTLTLNTDGTFAYTPDINFFGADSFSYEISDGNGGTAVARADITILPVNDAPVANDDSIRLNEDTIFSSTLGIDDLLVNDSDVENDTITVATAPVVSPAFGTVVINSNGDFTYTPQADFHGVDTFVYEITDGNDTDQGSVTIVVDPVPDAPVANADAYTLDEDTAFTATLGTNDLLLNDFDADGDTLTVTSTTTMPANGALTVLPNGTFTYTPNTDFFGVDTFSYQISDGTFTAETTVTLTVNAVNDAPVVTVNELMPVAYGQTVFITGADLNTIDVDDLPANTTYTTSGLIRGHLEFTDAPGVVVTSFTQADLDAGRLVYVHDGTTNATDSFTFQVTDAQGASASGQFNISIGPPPDAIDDAYRVTPGKALFVVGQGVVRNDQGIVASATTRVVTPPTNGTLEWNSDGTFVYTPNAGFIGTETIVYELSSIFGSDTATITISVPPVTQTGNADGASGGTSANPDIVEVPVPLPPQKAGEVKARPTQSHTERSHRSDGSGDPLSSPTIVASNKPLQTRLIGLRDARELRSRYELDLGSSFETGTFNVAYNSAQLEFKMSELLGGLDTFKESMMSSVQIHAWNVPRGLVLTGGLSLGWLLWTVKGGYLVGSLLSATTPTWSMVDPLPIFDSIDGRDKPKQGDVDFLDEMMSSQNSNK